MAHAQTPGGPDKGRRRFLGAVFAGIAALIGWPVIRSATQDEVTGSTLAGGPAQSGGTTSPTTGSTAASGPTSTTSASGATTSSATTATTSGTEVAGTTVTTAGGSDASGATAGSGSGGATSSSSATTSATTTTTGGTTTTTGPGGALALVVLEKASWSETPDASGFRVQDQITAITIHHTAVTLGDNRDAPDRFRQHEAYHRSQGWPDIAYHLLIDRNGNVFEGRPLWAIGDTFTNYDPTGHFLPTLEGDFNSQSPSAAQTDTLATVVAWAMNHYGLDSSVIAGHRDLAATSCPGTNLYSFISSAEFTDTVAARRAQGVELSYLRGPAAIDIVATVEA